MSSNTNSKNSHDLASSVPNGLHGRVGIWQYGQWLCQPRSESRRFLDDSLPLLLHSVHVDGGGNGLEPAPRPKRLPRDSPTMAARATIPRFVASMAPTSFLRFVPSFI